MSQYHGSLEGILPSDVDPSGIYIKVSAPGKVILHGEHSVVYGKLAVAAALGLRSTFHLLEIQTNNTVILDLPLFNMSLRYSLQEINNLLDIPLPVEDPKSFSWEFPQKILHEDLLMKSDKFIELSMGNKIFKSQELSCQRAVFYLIFGILGSVDIHLPSIFIHADTELNVGAGTGSSASFLVSLAALLVQYVKTNKISGQFSKSVYRISSWEVNLKDFHEKELELICNWAFHAEKIMHGTPSGIDNTVCTYGSLVEFRKGFPLKLIPIKTTFRILLINSKVNRETKTLVIKAAQLLQKYPNVVENIFNAIEELAVAAIEKIRTLSDEKEVASEIWKIETNKLYEELGSLVSINQNLLASLGVSHPRLDEIIQILSDYGLHGKLTGAGGGGYAIALVPPFFNEALLENVQKVLRNKGFEVNAVTVGGKGVAVE